MIIVLKDKNYTSNTLSTKLASHITKNVANWMPITQETLNFGIFERKLNIIKPIRRMKIKSHTFLRNAMFYIL